MATVERKPRRRHAKHDPSIGARMKQARTEAAISQRVLCEDLPYTAAYVSRIEGGERTPSVTAIRLFAEKLGVEAEWLETGNGPRSQVTLPVDLAVHLLDRLGDRHRVVLRLEPEDELLVELIEEQLKIEPPPDYRPRWLPPK